MSDNELNRKAAELVMGYTLIHGKWYDTNSGKHNTMFDVAHNWSPSTNAQHDYEVLCKVREMGFEPMCGIRDALVSQWQGRISEEEKTMTYDWYTPLVLNYQPGDYARAALQVLEATP